MERLQSEGIRGADLVFACIGPALEIFSRYSKVETAEGHEVGLPEFLEKVWEVVGRTALEQVLETADLPTPRLRQAGATAGNSTAGLPAGVLTQAGALEEDARLTALFLWTLQSTNGESPSPAPSPRGRGERSEDSPTKGRGRKMVDSFAGEQGDEEEDIEDEEEEAPKKKKQGYSLIFDVVRRFAQPLGIHLPEWEDRIIQTEKGVVRLLSVKERAKQLFGEESVSVAGFKIEEQARRDPQMKFDFAVRSEGAYAPDLPAEALAQAGIKARRPRKKKEEAAEASPKTGVTTTLDRVHAAMLLQAGGQTNALRALLKAEQDRGPDFLRLANALSALYPKDSEEKRLLDAMLLAMPR
jgi:putative DNA methylase